jgi:hypothetical protein
MTTSMQKWLLLFPLVTESTLNNQVLHINCRKLFELLVLSGALAELTWPAILNKRDIFRYLFSFPYVPEPHYFVWES